jgi:hypothetical protein
MIDFTDKVSYIEAIAAWKNQYVHLSKNIRRFKEFIFTPHHEVTWKEYGELNRLKQFARDMLELRKVGKEQAQLMWLMQNGQ